MNIHTTIERITPEQAQHYLEYNTNNRNMRASHVERLSSDILNNRWTMNGSSIVFNGDGTLLDGQHRLAAIVKAGLPVEMLVVRGVSKNAMPTIDANLSRTAADAINLLGVKNATRVAAAARMLLTLKVNEIGSTRKRSNTEIIEFIQKHPMLAECATVVEDTADVMPQSIIVPWYYMAFYLSGQQVKADTAHSVLATGIPAYDGDPIHIFRERVIRMETGLKSSHRSRAILMWTLIASWNDFVKGEQLKICKLRQSAVQMAGVDYSKI